MAKEPGMEARFTPETRRWGGALVALRDGSSGISYV